MTHDCSHNKVIITKQRFFNLHRKAIKLTASSKVGLTVNRKCMLQRNYIETFHMHPWSLLNNTTKNNNFRVKTRHASVERKY